MQQGTSTIRNTVTSGIQHHRSQTMGTESQNKKEKAQAKELLITESPCVVVLLTSAHSTAFLLLMIFFIYLFSKHFRSEEAGSLSLFNISQTTPSPLIYIHNLTILFIRII